MIGAAAPVSHFAQLPSVNQRNTQISFLVLVVFSYWGTATRDDIFPRCRNHREQGSYRDIAGTL